MGLVKAVCISREKGTRKEDVKEAVFKENHGLVGDAHAGHGAYLGAELAVDGYDFKTLPVGTKFQCGTVILRMTQIGKECHHGCEIFQTMGDCIMPREGVFCVVEHGGMIKVGDSFEIVENGN